LTFSVAAPPEVRALELLPLKYERETTEKATTSAPPLKIGAKGITVEVGKVFEHEVSFKSLRPTLVASRLLKFDALSPHVSRGLLS
jgi:hypothetical protein